MTPHRLPPHGDIMQGFRHVHFIGIGGAGMSGIAEVMHTLGYDVSGSDRVASPVTEHLAALGVHVDIGHDAAHVARVDAVVVSSAIQPDNPELLAARERRIPIVPRAEMLGELMRFRRGIAIAGSHGKTTTTSLTASVLAEAGYDPTFVIGGQLLSAGANARLGAGAYLVAEADESDGSFLKLSPVIAVVTNIDADHLDHYHGDFAELKQAFTDFLHRLPFYGLAVLCMDNPEVAELAAHSPRSTLTYAIEHDADVHGANLRAEGACMFFDLLLPGQPALEVKLNLPGRHNVLDALAAATIGWHLGVEPYAIARALARFQGVGRRFHINGELPIDAGRVMLVDDYGHHPRELAAVMEAARAGWPGRRLVIAFQPHRYTRTRDLMDDFAAVLCEADALVLTDVYPAGETPITGADGRALARAVRARGKVVPVFVGHPREFEAALPPLLRDGDLLLLLGAGDIGAEAVRLAARGHLKSEATP